MTDHLHPEHPMPPESHPAEQLKDFVLKLRQLRRDAGSPSFREMSYRAENLGVSASHASLHRAVSGEHLPSLTALTAFVRVCLSLNPNTDHDDIDVWRERWERVASGISDFRGSVAGNVVNQVNYYSPAPTPDLTTHNNQGINSLATRRQEFFFDFLKHSLKQSEMTFRLSVAFMTGGAVVILIGAVLALVYARSADLSFLPLVTGLTGALITVGGGALAVHARRAKAHVTEQADRINKQIDKDHGLEKATNLIDRVKDPELRDRLTATAAMQTLDVRPNPETITDRLLPEVESDSKGEIRPGSSSS